MLRSLSQFVSEQLFSKADVMFWKIAKTLITFTATNPRLAHPANELVILSKEWETKRDRDRDRESMVKT